MWVQLHNWRVWVVLQAPNRLIVSWLINPGIEAFDSQYSTSPHFLFLWNVTPVHAAFAQRHEGRLKDPGRRKARVPLTTYSCVWVRVCHFVKFWSSLLFLFFSCDKHACPPDPPGGLRTAVSHEPFWQAHFEGFRMWWQGVLATRLCERVCVCVCRVTVSVTVYLRGWRVRGIESDWQTIWVSPSLCSTVCLIPPVPQHTPPAFLPLRLCEPSHNAGTLKWQ